MVNVIVMGHGGYAKGVKANLEMVVGVPDHFYFIDLEKNEDLSEMENKVNSLLSSLEEGQVLFVCDLLGASPFRVAAVLTGNQPDKYCTVAGINMMAFMELTMSSDALLEEVALQAVETTKKSVCKFPE